MPRRRTPSPDEATEADLIDALVAEAAAWESPSVKSPRKRLAAAAVRYVLEELAYLKGRADEAA
jgi:hypothetical protein